MPCTTHRLAFFAALWCALLLTAGMAAMPAKAGPAASAQPTEDVVFTWSGGGEGNDLRDSAPFTLKGGRQVFHSFAVALPARERRVG